MQTRPVEGQTPQPPCASGGPQPRSAPWRTPTRSWIRPSTGSTVPFRQREIAPPISLGRVCALWSFGLAGAGGGAGGGAQTTATGDDGVSARWRGTAHGHARPWPRWWWRGVPRVQGASLGCAPGQWAGVHGWEGLGWSVGRVGQGAGHHHATGLCHGSLGLVMLIKAIGGAVVHEA